MEFFRVILSISRVVTKVGSTPEKIIIRSGAGIPGTVQIVVQRTDFCDVPTVGTTAVTGNKPGVNPQFQCKTIEQQRITLTHSRIVHQCRISRMFQIIGRVFQILVVIGDIFTDVIIDGKNFMILRIIVNIQFIQHRINAPVQFRFLCSSSIVGNSKRNIPVNGSVIRTVTSATTSPSTILPSQVITFRGNAGMSDGNLESFPNESLQRFLINRINLQIQSFLTVLHTTSNHSSKFLRRTNILAIIYSSGLTGFSQIRFREGILVERIDVDIIEFQRSRFSVHNGKIPSNTSEAKHPCQHKC